MADNPWSQYKGDFFFLLRNNTELRRRKRLERKENMEEKIQQIKRKQREVEDGAISAKKRRSIFIIAAGVTIAAFCVYLYTKL